MVGLMGLFALVFWIAMKSRRMVAAPPPTLVVDERYLSVGEVWEDPAFVWTLPIRNTTNKDVEIVGFAADCSCARIEPPSLKIPAQGTREVRLTLDLRVPHRDPDSEKVHPAVGLRGESSNAKCPYQFTIKLIPVYPNGPDPLGGWEITGQVRQVGTLVPNEVHFDDTLARGTSNVKKKVAFLSKVPVRQVVATCDPAVAKLEVKRETGNAEKYDIIVIPKTDRKIGAFKAEGKVQLTLTTGEQLPPLLLPISGVLLEDIQARPASLLLGVVTVGTTVDESFLIFSDSDSPFELEQVDVPTGSKVQVVRQVSEGVKQLKLTQEITHRGDQRISLRFRARHQKNELATEILVPVVYYGFDPHP
jgi:hypothetical protein